MNLIKTCLAAITMLGATALSPSLSAADGVKVDHLGVNNTLVRISGDSRYLLLPVQESNEDDRIDVLVDGRLDKTIYVKLAKNKVDYFVPLELAPYKGHEVVLNILTTQGRSTVREAKDDACWKNMTLSEIGRAHV